MNEAFFWIAVLPQTSGEIVGNADIESGMTFVREDVDEVVVSYRSGKREADGNVEEEGSWRSFGFAQDDRLVGGGYAAAATTRNRQSFARKRHCSIYNAERDFASGGVNRPE